MKGFSSIGEENDPWSWGGVITEIKIMKNKSIETEYVLISMM